MAMGKRKAKQRELWVSTNEIPKAASHPFYAKANEVLERHKLDRRLEYLCRRFYKPVFGRPSMAPGVYFRMLLVGFFEGIDSERGIAWRVADSLSLREFAGYSVTEQTPDHSTISRTRRLLPLETHKAVFRWFVKILGEEGLIEGQTIAIDATTLEANAAMRSIRRRDDGRRYEEYLKDLAQAEGLENPTREQLARRDRKRKKKGSNREWMSPADPDARITKMKDGRTHLAHKAEHAIDLSSGAMVAVTLQAADQGDTTTIQQTLKEAHANATLVNERGVEETVADKGYHSNQVMVDLHAEGIRSYIPEPERGPRQWQGKEKEQRQVYANRRRTNGRRGKDLQKLRSELTERSFAHMYETGGMRRTHLRKRSNILKRLLLHAVGFNLALLLREHYGIGKPRTLQGISDAILLLQIAITVFGACWIESVEHKEFASNPF
ncbi:MAG: transposase [Bryobacteraceae bacterium]|jgi:transposase